MRSHPDLTAVTTINEAAPPGIRRASADTGLRVPYDCTANSRRCGWRQRRES